jgi:flagellin
MNVGGESKQLDLTAGMSAADLAGQINGVSGVSGVKATSEVAINNFGGSDYDDKVKLSVEGVEINFDMDTDNDTTVTGALAAITPAIKEALLDKGIVASNQNDGTNSSLVFTNKTGENISVSMEITGGSTTGDGSADIIGYDTSGGAGAGANVGNAQSVAATASGVAVLGSAEATGRLNWDDAIVDSGVGSASLVVAGNGTTLTAANEIASFDPATSLLSIADIDVSSAGGSQSAIDVIDAALATIGDSRADLGAVQNRFSQTIGNLANIQENASASRSRIQDTDYATETAVMTKNQILQQAGTSILAQANQIPQAAISLIGG